MYMIALATCMACVGQGRRVQQAVRTEHSQPSVLGEVPSSAKAFARLLLESNELSAGWAATVTKLKGPSQGGRSRYRLGAVDRQKSVTMKEDDTVPSGAAGTATLNKMPSEALSKFFVEKQMNAPAKSSNPFMSFLTGDVGPNMPEPSDAFITNRVPALRKARRLVLAFYFGYCFKKGWIGQYGLIQGGLMSQSYLDALAVPMRAVTNSPFYGKPYFLLQLLIDLVAGLIKTVYLFSQGNQSIGQVWQEIKDSAAEAQKEQQEKQKQKQMEAGAMPSLFPGMGDVNSSQAMPSLFGGMAGAPGANESNGMASMFGAPQNTTDQFLLDRFPVLKKPKRIILITFFWYCLSQGWISRWGFVFGAFLTRSYFDMLAMPLRLFPTLGHPSLGFSVNNWMWDKPIYFTQIIVQYAFQLTGMMIMLARGQNPFENMMAGVKQSQEEWQKKMEELHAPESSSPKESHSPQSASGPTKAVDVEVMDAQVVDGKADAKVVKDVQAEVVDAEFVSAQNKTK